MRAMELNGVQVDNNKAAFEWGRRCAHDLAAVRRCSGGAGDPVRQAPSLDELLGKRVEFLTAYQNAAYAAQYRAFVDKVRAAESLGRARADRGRGALPVQADGLQGRVRGGAPAHRPGLHPEDRAMFEGDYKLVHHLAPPLAKKDDRAICSKSLWPWMRKAMGWLAGMKGCAARRSIPSAAPRSAAPSAP
jgi:indolepyruvate ferredoxin oxidoreductase